MLGLCPLTPGTPSTRGWYFSQKVLSPALRDELREGSPCKEGEPAPLQRSDSGGALFAVMVQIFLRAGAIAVQGF